MQNEIEYPKYKYYLLVDKHTMKPFKIELCNRHYMFIANREYFINPKKEFFSLKEKLYVLNFSYEVLWRPISQLNFFYRNILCNTISPSSLQLNITKGKVSPYISKKGRL